MRVSILELFSCSANSYHKHAETQLGRLKCKQTKISTFSGNGKQTIEMIQTLGKVSTF